MVLEREILDFWDWLLPHPGRFGALLTFGGAVVVLLLLALIVSYIGAIFRHGFVEGFFAIAKSIVATLRDFTQTSPRRVWAMARLAMQEAIRRKILIAFAVFVVILLFASWFLDTKSDHPGRIYLSFVLTASNFLVVVLTLFLSAFSLPTDIKNRTIYTIVTKPVRAHEIVLGRIFGFALVGTAILACMCVVSYVFVVRGLSHSHEIDPQDLTEEKAPNGEVTWKGLTSRNAHHRHEVTIYADGVGETNQVMDHRHAIVRKGEGADAKYEFGPPDGALLARVPVYGKLRFMDRTGKPAASGKSVGDEWAYRSFIEGGTPEKAVWTFSGITPQRFPNGLPIEMTIEVFRTHKGDIEKTIEGELVLRNPETGVETERRAFRSNDMAAYQMVIRDFPTRDGKTLDLFQDLVDSHGRIEVLVSCKERAQYFGMSQADLYLRAAEGSFAWNFIKGYISLWYQMVIVTCFGVLFSTFLSGPVALVTTIVSIVMGYATEFISGILTGKVVGGGPIVQFIRTYKQLSISVDLEVDPRLGKLIYAADWVILVIMRAIASIFPPYDDFSTSEFVASGYDIFSNLLAQHGVMTFGYVLVITLFSCLFLKSREVAA